jgi:hypothetical protein
MFLLNMIDLVWVNRINLVFGISDEVFVLGDETIAPMIARWNTMPMLILASQLCPTNVEATFFAMTMVRWLFESIILHMWITPIFLLNTRRF